MLACRVSTLFAFVSPEKLPQTISPSRMASCFLLFTALLQNEVLLTIYLSYLSSQNVNFKRIETSFVLFTVVTSAPDRVPSMENVSRRHLLDET